MGFPPHHHQGDLEELLSDWSEDRSVGDVILKYVSPPRGAVGCFAVVPLGAKQFGGRGRSLSKSYQNESIHLSIVCRLSLLLGWLTVPTLPDVRS